MKNGDIIFVFRARMTSPDKAYEPYISPYVCLYKNGRGVIFQPFEIYNKKTQPYEVGLWSDCEHYLESPLSIGSYFKIKEEKAVKLMGELRHWHDATRGVCIIEMQDLLDHVNNELKKYGLPTYRSLETLYASTENWQRWKY